VELQESLRKEGRHGFGLSIEGPKCRADEPVRDQESGRRSMGGSAGLVAEQQRPQLWSQTAV